jgi:hypothetical protein
MTLFPPSDATPVAETVELSPSLEKSVLNGLRLMTKAEKDLQARLDRVGADIDCVLAAFVSGGIVASDRVLAVIAERQRTRR